MWGKWKLLILWYLNYNVMRFGELRKILSHVTEKMLTQHLRELEESKLIYRKVYPVVPPKVEYGLTEMGKKLIPILELMHKFGAEYLAEANNNDVATHPEVE
ncbi:MAG: helix-turn-helix domain-containing protein [Carboxydocellales bacterium]